MSDVDKRVREAYQALRVSDSLKSSTIASMERMRAKESDSAERQVADEADGVSSKNHEAPLPDESVFYSLYASKGQGDSSKAGDVLPSVRRRTRPRLVQRAVAAVAACAVVVAVGAGGYAYAMTPVAHVGIDVNPSFELAVNRFDRVVEARAVSGDAAAVLDRIDIFGLSYEEALAALAEACDEYTGQDAVVEVGVACDDETRCAAIEAAAMRCFESDAAVHCGRVDDEQRQAANDSGMGMGRYRVYEALVEQGIAISQEDAASMPMRELRALAEESGVDTGDSACSGHGGTGASCSEGRHGQGSGGGRAAGQGQGGRGDGQGQAGQPQGQEEGGGQGYGYGRDQAGSGGQGGGRGQSPDASVAQGGGYGQGGEGSQGNGSGQGRGYESSQGATQGANAFAGHGQGSGYGQGGGPSQGQGSGGQGQGGGYGQGAGHGGA